MRFVSQSFRDSKARHILHPRRLQLEGKHASLVQELELGPGHLLDVGLGDGAVVVDGVAQQAAGVGEGESGEMTDQGVEILGSRCHLAAGMELRPAERHLHDQVVELFGTRHRQLVADGVVR